LEGRLMRDKPDAVTLLRLARAALLEDLLPMVPQEGRYAARLIANAMAVAAREMAAGVDPAHAELRALATLFGEEVTAPDLAQAPETVEETLARLNWRLAAEIRSGGRDADPQVYAALWDETLARARVAEPRAVPSSGEGTKKRKKEKPGA